MLWIFLHAYDIIRIVFIFVQNGVFKGEVLH